MTVEFVVIFVLWFTGTTVLDSISCRTWITVPLGIAIGVLLYMNVAYLVTITGVSSRPTTHSLLATVGISLLAIVSNRRGTLDATELLKRSFAIGALTLILVSIFRVQRLDNVNHDSFEHMTIGAMLHDGQIPAINTAILQYRGIAVPLLHSGANATGELYWPSISPLLAITLLAYAGWIVSEGCRLHLNTLQVCLFAGLTALLILSVNRFVFNAFYINGHLLVALTLLLVCGAGWLQRRNDDRSYQVYKLLQLLALPVLAVVRPETSLLAVIAILPLVLDPLMSRRYRTLIVAVWFFFSLSWQLFIVLEGIRLERLVPTSVLHSLIGLCVVLVILLSIVRKNPSIAFRQVALPTVEIGAWLALIPAVLLYPDILKRSVHALLLNAYSPHGYWGTSILFLSGLVLLATIAPTPQHNWSLRLAVTTFIPTALLFSIARGGAYRVSEADSLNRMLFHALPLAVVYVVSTSASLASGRVTASYAAQDDA